MVGSIKIKKRLKVRIVNGWIRRRMDEKKDG